MIELLEFVTEIMTFLNAAAIYIKTCHMHTEIMMNKDFC